MRKYFVVLSVVITFFSCSKDDSSNTENILSKVQGVWVFERGSYVGNGISGSTDPYFNGTVLDLTGEIQENIILNGTVKYPNGLENGTRFIDLPKEKYLIDTFIDNGVKVSNNITMRYYHTENLILPSGESMEIELIEAFDIKNLTESQMILKKQAGEYDITYYLSKKE